MVTCGEGEVPSRFRLRCYQEVSSTNDLIKSAIHAGQPEGLVVRSRRQSGGYGRQGRRWVSPEGGLYQSMLLRPDSVGEHLPTLALAVGLAARRSLEALAPRARDDLRVKWPNDVMAGSGKMVGISCELHGGALCVGTGFNVMRPREEKAVGGKNFPAYIEDYLERKAGPWIIDDLGNRFLEIFDRYYDDWLQKGFAPFLEEYLRYSYLQGRVIRLALGTGDTLIEGTVIGVDDQGRLLVESDGCIHPCTSGEAHIL